MNDTPIICGHCRERIHNTSGARHFGHFMAHQEGECLSILFAKVAAVTAERDALLSEINKHNAGCESACAARFVGADNRPCRDTYNGRMCPDCPRDWLIDLRRP